MYKTTVLASCLFPPVPWMAALIQSDQCIVDIHETYSKQTFRNRYTIATANGPHDLNIPVNKPYGNRTKTSEVLIPSFEQVARRHFIAIESAYGSSPYFEYFADDILDFFNGHYTTLIEANLASLLCISRILRFEFSFSLSQNYIKGDSINDQIIDLRNIISPKNKKFYQFSVPCYYQVFTYKNVFQGNLSVLDLIMNMGLETLVYLQNYPLKEFINFASE